jgi:nucleotide-binding universal stress UspA family protein
MAKLQTEADAYLSGAGQRIDTSVRSHAPAGASLTITYETSAHLSVAAALVVSARSLIVSQRQEGAVSIPSCGVIALATPGQRGVARRIFGGITEQIIQMTDLPILVVPLAIQAHDMR